MPSSFTPDDSSATRQFLSLSPLLVETAAAEADRLFGFLIPHLTGGLKPPYPEDSPGEVFDSLLAIAERVATMGNGRQLKALVEAGIKIINMVIWAFETSQVVVVWQANQPSVAVHSQQGSHAHVAILVASFGDGVSALCLKAELDADHSSSFISEPALNSLWQRMREREAAAYVVQVFFYLRALHGLGSA